MIKKSPTGSSNHTLSCMFLSTFSCVWVSLWVTSPPSCLVSWLLYLQNTPRIWLPPATLWSQPVIPHLDWSSFLAGFPLCSPIARLSLQGEMFSCLPLVGVKARPLCQTEGTVWLVLWDSGGILSMTPLYLRTILVPNCFLATAVLLFALGSSHWLSRS